MDLDALDQNVAINKAGKIIGKLKPVDNKPKGDALQVRQRRCGCGLMRGGCSARIGTPAVHA